MRHSIRHFSPKKFLFYDFETTGLSPVHDRALQFAGVCTDAQFNPQKTHQWRMPLPQGIVPHPEATLVHKIPLQKWKKGELEYPVFKQMHALFNAPGTINLGYNSLAFDDLFLRFGFYRNLLPVYSHQYANGCSRMDMYPMALMFWAYAKAPQFTWPVGKTGRPSFKLADLKEANQLADGLAHDALVDVNATIGLARKLRDANPVFWDETTAFFDKEKDRKKIATCPSTVKIGATEYPVGFMMRRLNSYHNHFLAPVVYLGEHKQYKNQTLWLRLDKLSPPFTQDAIATETAIIRKKAGETPFFLPLNFENSAQLIQPAVLQDMLDAVNYLGNNPELFRAISEFYQNKTYEKIEDIDAYAALYETGFPTKEEEALFRKFHAAESAEKMAIAMEIKHPVFHELAIRIIGHTFPAQLNAHGRELFEQYLHSTVDEDTAPVDYRGEYALSVSVALREVNRLRAKKSNPADQKMLNDLDKWYRGYPKRLESSLNQGLFKSRKSRAVCEQANPLSRPRLA